MADAIKCIGDIDLTIGDIDLNDVVTTATTKWKLGLNSGDP